MRITNAKIWQDDNKYLVVSEPNLKKINYCLIIGTKTSKMHYLQVVIINVHFVNVYQEKAVILRLSILSPNPYTPI